MNIKSLLLGSAAALAVVSGAQAADAIVAAEPEAVEYVKVCDAYGTGYFYIPGTETCLKVAGYIRFDVGFGFGDAYDNNGGQDWADHTRAELSFDSKSDTEYGTLTGRIALQGNYNGATIPTSGITGGASTTIGSAGNSVIIDEAYLDIAGFRAGKFASWWDNDFTGESDKMSNNTNFNAVRYTYDAGDFYAGVALEELGGISGRTITLPNGTTFVSPASSLDNNSLGIDASVGGKFGAFTWQVYGGYSQREEEGAVTARMSADIGPGTLEGAVVWSSGLNSDTFTNNYDQTGEWTFVAEYQLKATDKLTITPEVQYTSNIVPDAGGNWDTGHMWRAGATMDYKIVDNLSTRVSATYVNENYGNAGGSADWVEGFFRLQRDF